MGNKIKDAVEHKREQKRKEAHERATAHLKIQWASRARLTQAGYYGIIKSLNALRDLGSA